MTPRRLRFGIRTQLILIVLVAALLSTIATLYIANSAIQSYVIDQAKQREAQNLQVAWLVLHTEFGDNVSIDVNGKLVADSPLATSASGLGGTSGINALLPYPLDLDVDYVDEVHHLVGGIVAVYKCADARGNVLVGGCPRISTDIFETKHGQAVRNLDDKLNASVLQYAKQHGDALVEEDTVSGVQYIGAYQAMYSPQHDFIGVLFVGEPLAGVQDLILHTTLQLGIIGGLIMIVGAIFAILLAQAITGTLQSAARQVSTASAKFGVMAAQQSSGSAQQVWAIDAIAQAIHNLSETANDIAKRSDQLAQMGMQVLQRRAEISPTQMDSIINYVTRSMHDISIQSRQQAATCDRMSGAMQAVTEVAQQVSGDSKQAIEGAERLEEVVQQLQRLVGTKELSEANMETGKPGPSIRSTNLEMKNERSGSRGTLITVTPAPPAPLIRAARPTQAGRTSASTTWPPATNQSGGISPTPPPTRPSPPSSVRDQSKSEGPAIRPRPPRPPMRYTSMNEPDSYASFDQGSTFPDNGDSSTTFPPPRRDPRGRS